MTICLDTAFAQPGIATAYMADNDMGFDPETGEFVPRWQFVDRHGVHDTDDIESDYDAEVSSNENGGVDNNDAPPNFSTAQEELLWLIGRQKADGAAAHTTSTKTRPLCKESLAHCTPTVVARRERQKYRTQRLGEARTRKFLGVTV